MNWLGSVRESVGIVGCAALELIQGCRDGEELRRTLEWLNRYEHVWPTRADCIRALERFGERRLRFGLDVLDALIAETAIGSNIALHTFNVKHFAAYPELMTIRPYEKIKS